MIPQLNTAFLGGVPRTDRLSGEPDVGKTDPFRPGRYLVDDEGQDPVAMDDVFGLLGNQRRRYVLKYLSTTNETITLSELAEQIAAWERGKDIAEITSKERERTYVSLYQCHLPKMAEVTAISYDKQRGEIESGEKFDRFTHFLRSDE